MGIDLGFGRLPEGTGASADADQALVSDQAASRLAPTGFDPSREEDACALEAWAFNVMLECSNLDDEPPSEVAIGGAILDLRALDRILTWARSIATEGDPDAATGCADDLGAMTVPEAEVAEIIAGIAVQSGRAIA